MLVEEIQEVVLVTACGDSMVGLLVDVVDEIRDVDSGDIEDSDTATMGAETDYVKGLAKVGDSVKILVDLEKITHGVAGKLLETAEV
jgi:purine-binding chemotaxis protein CheW